MNIQQLLLAARHPAEVHLPMEGELPSLGGATAWLNAPPLSAADLRYHHFGEGAYELSEMLLQHLLAEAGIGGFDHELVSVDARGAEVAADWGSLRSPETYVGFERTENFASPGGAVLDRRHVYA